MSHAIFQSSLLFCSFSIHFTVKRISKECARKPGKKICRQGGMYDLNATYTMPQKKKQPEKYEEKKKEKKKEELCCAGESNHEIEVYELFRSRLRESAGF